MGDDKRLVDEPDPDPGGLGPEQPMPGPAPPLQIAQLVQAHHQAVFRYAYRLAGSVPDAEDLTQQTFLVAQRKLDQIREPDKADRWLFAVLRSCFLKNRRRRQPASAGNLGLDMDAVVEPREERPIDRELLQLVLNDLPDQHRVILVMFYFEQCSYKEIASRLEVPMGTVMSRLARAKTRLRDALLARQQD